MNVYQCVDLVLLEVVEYACTYMNQSNTKHYTVLNFWTRIRLIDTNIKIGGLYRCPSNNSTIFLRQLSNLIHQYRDCIWLGDLNFNIINDRNQHYTVVIAANHYKIINGVDPESYTYHHTDTGSSIIDHVFTDLMQYKYNCYVRRAGFTDHDAVIANVGLELQRTI